MRPYLAIIILVFIFIVKLQANDKIRIADKCKMKISFLNEGIMIPLYPHLTSNPIHPGMQVGVEYYYKIKKKSQFFQTVNIGFFTHNKFEHGLYLNSEVGYRYILPFGISFDGFLGLGYLHTISDLKQYKQNSNGLYTSTTSYGRPHLLADAAISLGYDFSKKTNINIHPFLSYQIMIEYPWSTGEYGLSPFLPRTILHLGMIINLPFKH